MPRPHCRTNFSCRPSGWHKRGGGLNDRFSFGEPEVMRHVGSRFDNAELFVEKANRSVHAESLLRFVVKHRQYQNYNIAYQTARVRAGGRVAEIFKRSTRSLAGSQLRGALRSALTYTVACHHVLRDLNATSIGPQGTCPPGVLECNCRLPSVL